VTDRSEGFDDPLAGYVLYGDDPTRTGLWLAGAVLRHPRLLHHAGRLHRRLTTRLPPPEDR
jgi:hypothetical protein